MALSNMRKRAQRSGGGGRTPSVNIAVKIEEIVAGKDADPNDHVVGRVIHDIEGLGLKTGDLMKVKLREYDKGYRRAIHQLGRKDGNERKVHPGGIVVFENVWKDHNNADPDMYTSGWARPQVHKPFDPEDPNAEPPTEMVFAGHPGTVYQADMERGRQTAVIAAPSMAERVGSMEELEQVAQRFLVGDENGFGAPGIIMKAVIADDDPAAKGEDRNRFSATFSLWRKQDEEGEWRFETPEEAIERLREVAQNGRGNIGGLLQDFEAYDAAEDGEVVWTVEPCTLMSIGPKSLPRTNDKGRYLDLASDFTFGNKNKYSLWTDSIIGLRRGEESGVWVVSFATTVTNKFDAEYRSLSDLVTPHTPENHAEYIRTEGFTTRKSNRNQTNENGYEETDPNAEAEAPAP